MPIIRIGLVVFFVTISPAALADERAERFLAAARSGDTATARALLDEGVDVNVRTQFGATALAYAAEHGHLELTRVLLAAGADVRTKDSIYKHTPAMWALKRGHLDILQLLVSAGADEVDEAVSWGAEAGHIGLVRAALKYAPPKKNRLTDALVFAEQNGHSGVVAILKKAGAEPLPDMPITIPTETLDDIAGRYVDRKMGTEVTFRRFGSVLKGRFYGQEEFSFWPTDEHTFRSVEVPNMVFNFDVVDGHCRGATLNQAGQTLVYDREGRRRSMQAYLLEPGKRVVEDLPKPVANPQNWPQFRGAHASGGADGQHPPIYWDVGSGRNIRWKTPVPGLGHASPIVWDDRVYVVTAIPAGGRPEFTIGRLSHVDVADDADEPHAWRLYSIEKSTGKIVWGQTIHEGVPGVNRHRKSSHASSTPATDGKHIVTCIGSGGLFCHSVDGEMLWEKDLGPLDAGWFYDPSYQWGFGSSPIIHNGRVYLQVDRHNESFIAAYDLKTGEELWKTARMELPSWSTPTIIEYDGKTELVTNGSLAARGYNADTGEELWRLAPGSLIAFPTPIYADKTIFITSGYFLKIYGGYWGPKPIYAVRAGSRGDLSLPRKERESDSIVWSSPRAGSFIPTPIVYGEHFYTADYDSVLGCFDVSSGKRNPREYLGGCGTFSASPVAADGRIYHVSEEGEVIVLKAGPEFEPLAINFMGEPTMATPAISDGMLFIRTIHHLYGIGHTTAAKPESPDQGTQ